MCVCVCRRLFAPITLVICAVLLYRPLLQLIFTVALSELRSIFKLGTVVLLRYGRRRDHTSPIYGLLSEVLRRDGVL